MGSQYITTDKDIVLYLIMRNHEFTTNYSPSEITFVFKEEDIIDDKNRVLSNQAQNDKFSLAEITSANEVWKMNVKNWKRWRDNQ